MLYEVITSGSREQHLAEGIEQAALAAVIFTDDDRGLIEAHARLADAAEIPDRNNFV